MSHPVVRKRTQFWLATFTLLSLFQAIIRYHQNNCTQKLIQYFTRSKHRVHLSNCFPSYTAQHTKISTKFGMYSTLATHPLHERALKKPHQDDKYLRLQSRRRYTTASLRLRHRNSLHRRWNPHTSSRYTPKRGAKKPHLLNICQRGTPTLVSLGVNIVRWILVQ